MPGRRPFLITNQIYHVFNKGIDDRPTFTDFKERIRAKSTILFYKFTQPPLKLSFYLTKSTEEKERILENLKKENKALIEIYCYCLMPNHYHFLLEQKVDNGIAKFMSQFQNSYTRYFNTKHKRKGSLFLDQFKAKRIETDEQFLHISRYIHLNPYTSYLVKETNGLESYPWSSFLNYIKVDIQETICQTERILSFFKDKDKYREFVYNQAEYQRELAKIKHLIFED